MNCLHCGTELTGKHCSNCGQKASTHRFSLKHFFTHDVLHGAFHLDKGFPYSIKELLMRPGHSIREYVIGKRSKHFNYITLLLILLGISIYLEQYTLVSLEQVLEPARPEGVLNERQEAIVSETQNMVKMISDFSRENQKAISFSMIPIYALLSFLYFRKAKQNYAEHLVLTFYKASGAMLLSFPLLALRIFVGDVGFIQQAYPYFIFLFMAYTFYFVYQYFSVYGYKRWLLILLAFLYSISEILFQSILGSVFAIGWLKYKGLI